MNCIRGLNHPRLTRPLRVALAWTLLAAHAVAEPVPDPTRPMAALLGDSAAVPAPKLARATAPAASAAAAAPRLQSVQMSANGASSALLDGRLVHVGDRVGEHSVATIDRHGLTLRGPRGEQRLPLLSGITQTASRAAPPAADTLATGTPQDFKP